MPGGLLVSEDRNEIGSIRDLSSTPPAMMGVLNLVYIHENFRQTNQLYEKLRLACDLRCLERLLSSMWTFVRRSLMALSRCSQEFQRGRCATIQECILTRRSSFPFATSSCSLIACDVRVKVLMNVFSSSDYIYIYTVNTNLE